MVRKNKHYPGESSDSPFCYETVILLVNFTSVCYYNNKRKEGDGMAQKDTSEKILES